MNKRPWTEAARIGLRAPSGLVAKMSILMLRSAKFFTLHEEMTRICVVRCDCSSVGIYLDTVNIFIRIAMILAGGGGSRRK